MTNLNKLTEQLKKEKLEERRKLFSGMCFAYPNGEDNPAIDDEDLLAKTIDQVAERVAREAFDSGVRAGIVGESLNDVPKEKRETAFQECIAMFFGESQKEDKE